MRIKLPSIGKIPQLNRKRDVIAGYVSPQDGSQATADTDKREMSDKHGNTVGFDDVANGRPWQAMRRWFRDFGA